MPRSRPVNALGAPLALARRNLWAKLFALGAAFLLWLFVNAGKRETQVVQLPIELRNLPEHTVLANTDRVDSVAVRLNGPGPLLASLDVRRAPVVVDLARVKLGEDVRVKLRDEMMRLPRGVRVLDIEPSRVPIRLEAVRRASVPVSLVRTGEPPEGYRIGTVKITPAKVVVTGPANVVERLQGVDTEPVDLAGLTAGTQRTVGLVRPDQVSLKPERVAVDIDVGQVIVSRELKRVLVAVRNVDRPFQLQPSRVNLTVRGPERAVQGLSLENGSVYVDGATRGIGSHVVQAEVVLPPGVEVVRWDPPDLRLEIREQRTEHGARR